MAALLVKFAQIPYCQTPTQESGHIFTDGMERTLNLVIHFDGDSRIFVAPTRLSSQGAGWSNRDAYKRGDGFERSDSWNASHTGRRALAHPSRLTSRLDTIQR